MDTPTQVKTSPQVEATTAPVCTTVFYDDSCPLCRREIALYRGLPAAERIEWQDVSGEQAQACLPRGMTQTQLMQRFHVRTPTGEMLSGARAFVHVWAQLPGWRYLSLLAKVPGMPWVMEALYRGFLKIRPYVQALVRRIDKTPR